MMFIGVSADEVHRPFLDRVMCLKEHLRLRGVYTKPTPRDIWYVSTAHSEDDIDETLEVAAEAFEAFAEQEAERDD